MRNTSRAVFLLGLLTVGCASWFMNGGKLVEGGYAPTVTASYTISKCTMSNGSSVAGPPGIAFQLVRDGGEVGIFERSADGSGAVITNRWSDAEADHYFGWVQSTGWEYVIPKDKAAQPKRLVYVGLETKEEGTVTKPISAVSGTCPLLPEE